MYALSVQDVSHWFGTNKVLTNVKFDVDHGQIVALVGPSGCGKSTLLRSILGTHPPKQGKIEANGRVVRSPNRDVGIVYQHYSLYDFLTARQNVAFGLLLDESSFPSRWLAPWSWLPLRKKHLEQADAFLKKVNLSAAADRYPHQMSGGMRQRVAIAQSLIMEPSILLLDEPFGALDEATREELQMMLLQLYAENTQAKTDGNVPAFTILIVTHELNEALYVSDRVLGLSQYHEGGSQGATIVYDRPSPLFAPTDDRDFIQFGKQKDELRHAVFNPEHCQHWSDFVTFWHERAEQAAQT